MSTPIRSQPPRTEIGAPGLCPILCLMVLLGLGQLGCADGPSGDTTPTTAPAPLDETQMREEIETWRQQRHERLLQPDGWLSLVGLSWLEPGANPVGSGEDNRIRLPTTAPEHLGVLHLDGQAVRFEAEPGAGATLSGQPLTSTELVTDADGEPTVIESGSVSFYIIVRQDRFGVRIKDSQAPSLLAFAGMDSYPIDLAWRLEARLEPYDPPKPISVPNILGTATEQQSPGALVFTIDGQSHRIDALPGGDDGSLFLVFGDTTSGKETYGGGRFLYTDPPGDNGLVTVDFNRAYNPPCVFTPYATCPLPPPQNKLNIAVRAGEKSYAHGAH